MRFDRKKNYFGCKVQGKRREKLYQNHFTKLSFLGEKKIERDATEF